MKLYEAIDHARENPGVVMYGSHGYNLVWSNVLNRCSFEGEILETYPIEEVDLQADWEPINNHVSTGFYKTITMEQALQAAKDGRPVDGKTVNMPWAKVIASKYAEYTFLCWKSSGTVVYIRDDLQFRTHD